VNVEVISFPDDEDKAVFITFKILRILKWLILHTEIYLVYLREQNFLPIGGSNN
jgi:hypothetical protein